MRLPCRRSLHPRMVLPGALYFGGVAGNGDRRHGRMAEKI
ncbi:hypothetical protein SAMN04244547_02260 [Azotobacter vinelandii]|nr:hypothetical protein SAMN04244547_02260 [Azotobacter vinelandii]